MKTEPAYLTHVAVHFNLSFIGPHGSRNNVQGEMGDQRNQKFTHAILTALKSALAQANLVDGSHKLLKAELQFQYCDLDD